MQRSGWKCGFPFACLFCWITTAAVSAPVPEMKPLEEGRTVPFVEGVDIPPLKPVLPTAPPTKSPTGKQAESKCVVSGALIVQREPVSGGLEGSPLDDDACGIGDPVGLQVIGEEETQVAFPGSVLVDCSFAQILSKWLLLDVMPAAEEHLESRLARIGSGPGYQCRRRNNLPDGKLSEHALGQALDISRFELDNGTTISIADDWAENSAKGRFLKDIHAAACKRFTTVLGPDADPNHKSHLHLDIGCHGRDCTYLICQ